MLPITSLPAALLRLIPPRSFSTISFRANRLLRPMTFVSKIPNPLLARIAFPVTWLLLLPSSRMPSAGKPLRGWRTRCSSRPCFGLAREAEFAVVAEAPDPANGARVGLALESNADQKLCHRAVLDDDVPEAVVLDPEPGAAVVAVDRVAVEVERDPAGADPEGVSGAIGQVVRDHDAPLHRLSTPDLRGCVAFGHAGPEEEPRRRQRREAHHPHVGRPQKAPAPDPGRVTEVNLVRHRPERSLRIAAVTLSDASHIGRVLDALSETVEGAGG
jgi:hypothetical protein